MNCKRHPKYKAIRRPTADCLRCKLIWLWRCIRKRLGLPVPQARRKEKFPWLQAELVVAYKPIRPTDVIPIIYKRQPSVAIDDILEAPASELPVAPENRGPEDNL